MGQSLRAEKGRSGNCFFGEAPYPAANGERCTLPEWGHGWSPGRCSFWCALKPKTVSGNKFLTGGLGGAIAPFAPMDPPQLIASLT